MRTGTGLFRWQLKLEPLISDARHPGGVAARRGQTEAEVVRGRLNYDVTNVVALVSRDIGLEIDRD